MTLRMKLWPDIAAINDKPFNFGDDLKNEHDPKKERGLQNKRLPKKLKTNQKMKTT